MKQLITQLNTLIPIKPTLKPPLISSTHLLKSKTHLKNPIISAKWGKKRSGSRTSRNNINNKLIFNAITAVASNLKILPEPLDSLIKDFWVVSGGGNGGNSWFKNGFGGDSGGRRRKRRKGENFAFWVILVISTSVALRVVLERERGINFNLGGVNFLWVSVVVAFVGYCLWRREIKDLILGFCFGAALMGLGLMNHDQNLVKWVDRFKGNFASFGVVSKKRRFRR